MLPRRSLSFRYVLLLVLSYNVAFVVMPLPAVSQTCTGTLQSLTQSTTFYSTGNAVYTPTFTQYSPPAGYVLVAAVLQSYTTVNATLQMTYPASETSPVTFRPSVTSEDELTVNGSDLYNGAVDVSDITLNNKFPPMTMNPGDVTTVGPTEPWSKFNIISDSITTASAVLNDFVGTGTASLEYYNYSSYSSAVTTTFSVLDTTTLNLTYYYCYTGTLASNILSFTAIRTNDQTIQLQWNVTNEEPGRKYAVERSIGNGASFSTIATQSADPMTTDAAYSYNYIIGSADKGQLFFRIRQENADGTAGYSQVRIIDLGANTPNTGRGFSIYPNPPTSDFINIIFPPTGSDWQVDILAADGSLVQRNYYSNVPLAQLNFIRPLSAGAYFVRAVDQQTAESHVAPFVIR